MTTASRNPDARLRGLTGLLAASAMGVYLLVVVGATTSLLDGAAACPTWPLCRVDGAVGWADPALAVAWAHRFAAVLVGLLLAVTVWRARRRGVDRRIRLALAGAVALYPVQIALGGLVVVSGAPASLSAAHLVVAMAIFSGVLVALLWHLEAVTPATPAVGRGQSSPTEPATTPTDVEPGEAARERPPTVRHRLRAYVRLTKPKLWWLLCLVALAAMGLAAGRSLDPATAAATLAGGVLAIGACGTFNNVLERDVDRRMARTADRPLVEGVVPLSRAVAFGFGLTVGSVVVFLLFVNALAAALGVLAILFYSVVYTLVLKPNTTWNTVVGGAVGAFPALIGWAAVENAVGTPAIVLGAVIFLWTPAHFYNLALAYREDYDRADVPMLPVVRGEAVTHRHILLFLGATMLGTVVLGATTRVDWLYAATAVVTGGVFLVAVIRLYHEQTREAAFRAFHASNAFLGLLLLAILLDTLAL